MQGVADISGFGSQKRRRTDQMSRDNTGGDAGNGGHEETQLDPMKNGWHVFRGPPDYTHVVLPWIYEQKIAAIEHVRDYQFRMTSPYQPLVTPQSSDLNIGAGAADGVGTHPTQLRGNFDKTVAYWDYYTGLYNYYSVLGCRYKIRIENHSYEKFYVHSMLVTNTDPPLTASNWDMLIWKGVKSQLVHPYTRFESITANASGIVEQDQTNIDTDTMTPWDTTNADSSTYATANSNRNQFAYIVGEYRPGMADQMVQEDSAVSIWTGVASNPTLKEALLVRIKPYDNATVPSAGDANNYERDLTYTITVECEYLVEFKELKAGLRWPVTRNPLTVTINSDPRNIGL